MCKVLNFEMSCLSSHQSYLFDLTEHFFCVILKDGLHKNNKAYLESSKVHKS